MKPSVFTSVAAFGVVAVLGACASANASSPPQTRTPSSQPSTQTAGAGDDLKAYPAPSASQARSVIRLPAHANEDQLKLELIVGRTLMVDCNSQRLGGRIDTRTAEGWGYDYFVVSDLGQGASTLMACPDNTKKQAFVRGGGEPSLIRYNSRLPVVVYAPQDVEVRYRVWRAGPEERVPR